MNSNEDPDQGFLTRIDALAFGAHEHTLSSAARSGSLKRVHPQVFARDVRLIADRGAWTFDDELAAARLYLGKDAVTYGTAAARLWGVQGVWRKHEHVELALPPGRELVQRPGFTLHTVKISDSDIVELNGILLTSPARTVTDLLLRLPKLSGVAVVDSALHLGLITVDDFAGIIERTYRRRGALKARGHLDLARLGAQSPLETAVRVVATEAGFEPDQLQVPIYDDHGFLLGFGDMGWRRKDQQPGQRDWLIAEADGVDIHSAPEALFRDRRRANDFLTRGNADIVRFTSEDVRTPSRIATVLRSALRT